MNSKKRLLIIFPALMACGLVSTNCQKNMYGQIKHLAPYLHQINYTDYVFDEKEETVHTELGDSMSMGGCVGIRKGNFYGRNFDNARRTMPEFVVRVSKKNKRHASIGIANSYVMREEDVYPENAVGVERFNILQAGYDDVKNAVDLRGLMKSVRYSNFYQNYHAFSDERHPDYSGYLNWWFTEEGTQTQLKYFKEWIIDDNQDPDKLDGPSKKATTLREVTLLLHEYETEFLPFYWSNIIADYRGEDMTGWITIHNSIYDIKKRSLLLTVQENYDKTYEFTL